MKYLLKEEMTALKDLPAIVEAYIRRIPEGDIDVKRSAEAWTIREHAYHLADVQKMLLERIETIRDAPDPVIEPYFPDGETCLDRRYGTLAEAFAEYKTLRKAQIKLIRSCSKEDFVKQAVHREYKRYGIPILVRHMIFHEYWHMYRIEEIWLTGDEFFK